MALMCIEGQFLAGSARSLISSSAGMMDVVGSAWAMIRALSRISYRMSSKRETPPMGHGLAFSAEGPLILSRRSITSSTTPRKSLSPPHVSTH